MANLKKSFLAILSHTKWSHLSSVDLMVDVFYYMMLHKHTAIFLVYFHYLPISEQ